MKTRFSGINAAKRLEKAETEPTVEPATEKPAEATETPRKVGRPKGKKSGGIHQQVTVYLPKDQVREIKIFLMNREGYIGKHPSIQKMDFSDAVSLALTFWQNREINLMRHINEKEREEQRQAQRDEKKRERDEKKQQSQQSQFEEKLSPDERYYSKPTIKSRGWTDAMINKLLGKSDPRLPQWLGTLRERHFYPVTKVEEIEKTKEFKEWQAKREKLKGK